MLLCSIANSTKGYNAKIVSTKTALRYYKR